MLINCFCKGQHAVPARFAYDLSTSYMEKEVHSHLKGKLSFASKISKK